ncbi:MAG: hypothetical protein PWQ63_665 [Methanolobus sp.]|nr:hypothetical protein [Methanolobus sp.]MDK2947505.1 hypothetical protein [Methanolobus sp.]
MKINIKFLISTLLASMLLIGFVFVVSADSNGSANDSNDKVIDILEEDLPEYGPQIYEKIKENKTTIRTEGNIPQIKVEDEKREWLQKLDQTGKGLRDQMLSYMQPNGPVVSYGYNYQGYMTVDFLEGKEIDDSLMNEIYEKFDGQASKMGIEEIPVVFQFTPQIEFTSRTSTWNPLIGGIKVEGSNGVDSTLGFAVRDSSTNEEGYLVSGHAALGTGGIGEWFYQPYVSSIKKAGTVDRLEFVYADAAFIEDDYRLVDNSIYYYDTDQQMEVTSYYEPDVGDYVRISGITSGLTSTGRVIDCKSEVSYLGYPTLYDQYIALYSSQGGDSGAPVFRVTGSDEVEIMGIQSGKATDGSYSIFSPISGIYADLGVVPLTS